MDFKLPKSDKYKWTRHAQYKMRQYGLSPQRVIRVIRNPQRTEEGIVEKTIAVMQPASVKYRNFKKTWSQEIWVMYQLRGAGNSKSTLSSDRVPRRMTGQILNTKYQISNNKLRIISAWRYPGISPKKDPIPSEILDEIRAVL